MQTDKLKLFLLIPLAAGLLVLSSMIQPKVSEGSKSTETESTRIAPKRAGTNEVEFLPMGLKLSLGLMGLLILAGGTIYLIRKAQGGLETVKDREIKLKESRRLSGKRVLHLVRAADRMLLLAESEHGLHLISDLTPSEEVLAAEDLATELQAARSLAVDLHEDEDDGAILRDMVIPRPEIPGKQTQTAKAKPSPHTVAEFKKILQQLGHGA